ncbi:MAG: hypothetical protein ACYDCK_02565 [Thermoplasmatota archaeon]
MNRVLALVLTTTLLAGATGAAMASAAAASTSITLDTTRLDMRTGDTIQVHSTVTNDGANPTSEGLVYLSLVETTQGVPVDLEDWTANRSAHVAPLAPHASATQTWTLRALVSGDFALYVVTIPNATLGLASTPTMSHPLVIHVTQRTNLNPGGVLPIALGVPTLLILGAFGVRWKRDHPHVERSS